MKYSLLIFSVFLFCSTTVSFAQEKEELSDFEIQKQFKTEYNKLQKQVDSVSIADSASAIVEKINAFEKEYQPHADLLDKALYPESFTEQVNKLKSNAKMAANRLQKMDKQDEQLSTLQLRLLAYQEHVEELTQDADSLRQAMEESIQSERELSGMVRNYRKNLEERDELILSFIDSTIVAYQKMDLQALKDLENMDQSTRIESNGDALKMIRDISAENLAILKENSEKLRIEDYVRMQSVQQRFEDMWSRMGDKIIQVYGGRNADELGEEVNRNIAQWDSLLDKQTFASLNDSLQSQGLEVKNFTSGDEFYNSLSAYLDKEIKDSKNGSSEASYNNFQKFRNFWNKVEREWSSDFVKADIMSNKQMATISTKTDRWSENAEPESNMMLYLLIGTAILALVLGGLLIREKNKNNA